MSLIYTYSIVHELNVNSENEKKHTDIYYLGNRSFFL